MLHDNIQYSGCIILGNLIDLSVVTMTSMSTLKGALKWRLIDGGRLPLCLSIKTASELSAF